MAVTRRRIPSTDPRLARHVNHDDRSRAYAYDTTGLSIVSAVHQRRIPVLDQGQVGSCTGNAGIGCLGTDPYYDTLAVQPTALSVRVAGVTHGYPLTEAGALALYSDAETIDGDGPYPPNDNGSTGLSIAKALKNAGEISGYQHAFSADDALKALGQTPAIVGINWYDSMFDPDQDGRVQPLGSVAGGHEIVADEIDATNQRVWFTNSWGDSWGVQRGGRGGRFYLTFPDFAELLSQQGDVTIFVPLTAPAPTPTPAPVPGDPDAALAAVAHPWVAKHHTTIAGNSRMQAALKTWLTQKGL